VHRHPLPLVLDLIEFRENRETAMVVDNNENKPVASARVLVVDDAALQRAMARDALEGVGMEVAVADGVASGWEQLVDAHAAGQPFHGLVLDWVMPVEGGAVLLTRILHDARFLDLCVVVFSSNPDHEVYRLVSQRQNCDIQDKSDMGLLAYRLRRFINIYRAEPIGGMLLTGPPPSEDFATNLKILFVDDSPPRADCMGTCCAPRATSSSWQAHRPRPSRSRRASSPSSPSSTSF